MIVESYKNKLGNNNFSKKPQKTFNTTSIMDDQLLRQKVHQKISVIKTNTFIFVVFKTKRELKC